MDKVLDVRKVVGSLPSTLAPSTFYAVRVGGGYDLYLSDSTGSTAHRLNTNIDRIGARNLILASQVSRTTQGTTVLNISQNIDYTNLTNLVLSVDVAYKNARKADKQGAKWFRIGAEFRFIYTDNTVKYYGAWAVIQDLSPTTFNGRITNHISVPTDKTIKMIDLAQIQIWDIVADEMLVKNPKLELGTIPTDWTPAPEDLQVDITNSINSLQIGGKNYFKKSTPLRVIGGGDFQKNSENGVTFTANQATKTLFRLLNVINSIGVWTVSCYAKATQNTRLFIDINDDGQVQDTGNRYWNEFNVGTEYQKIVATINTSKSNSVYDFVDFSTLSTETFTIKDLKIEKGVVATDYTTSPDDIQAQIEALSERVKVLESKASG